MVPVNPAVVVKERELERAGPLLPIRMTSKTETTELRQTFAHSIRAMCDAHIVRESLHMGKKLYVQKKIFAHTHLGMVE